jgi:adenosylhomocysteine nucleosidase
MPDTASALTGPLLVLVAMPEEAAPLTSRLEDPQPLPTPFAAGVAAVRGRLAGADAVVVTTGIGVAAATAAATWGILSLSPGLVVAAGSCGGLAADVEVDTVIVGERFAWSIADATAFGYAPGQLPGGPERVEALPEWVDLAERAARTAPATAVRRGLMLAGDAFVTAPLAAPMRERTAEALGVPFVALRAVSDLCGPAAGQQFHLELDQVAETSARAVTALAGTLAG